MARGMVTKMCILEVTCHMELMAQLTGKPCNWQSAQPRWDAGMLHLYLHVLQRLYVWTTLQTLAETHSTDQTLPMPELDITEATCWWIAYSMTQSIKPFCLSSGHAISPKNSGLFWKMARLQGWDETLHICDYIVAYIGAYVMLFMRMLSSCCLYLTGADCRALAKQWWGQNANVLSCDMFCNAQE